MSKCSVTFTCLHCGKKFNIETNGLIKFLKELHKTKKKHKKECRSC